MLGIRNEPRVAQVSWTETKTAIDLSSLTWVVPISRHSRVVTKTTLSKIPLTPLFVKRTV